MMKQRGFQLINPTEKWFPGLMEIRETFASWDWRFGKTPKFMAKKDMQLKSDDKEFAVQLQVNVDGVSILSFLIVLTMSSSNIHVLVHLL